MCQIETRICKLEQLISPTTAMYGTTISRVLMDHSLFKEYDLRLEEATGREASVVWCLALGAVHVPKEFFYGHSIEQAVEQAEQAFTK